MIPCRRPVRTEPSFFRGLFWATLLCIPFWVALYLIILTWN